MVNKQVRSNSDKKTVKNTPGGRQTVHLRRKKIGCASCADCGKKLAGVPAKRDSEVAKLSKSEKRPERAFGGVLCPKCLKDLIKSKIRK